MVTRSNTGAPSRGREPTGRAASARILGAPFPAEERPSPPLAEAGPESARAIEVVVQRRPRLIVVCGLGRLITGAERLGVGDGSTQLGHERIILVAGGR